MSNSTRSTVHADRTKCIGSGVCEVTAPTVFEVADDGLVAVLRPDPDDTELPAVQEAVRRCPSGALALDE